MSCLPCQNVVVTRHSHGKPSCKLQHYRAGSNHDRVIVVVERGRAGPLLVRLGEVDHSVAQEDVAAQQELSPAIGKEPVSAAVVFGTL